MPTPTRSERPRPGGSSGFTLIELMISMMVFIVAVAGLVAMQRASLGAADLGRQQTAATDIARFFLTQIKTEFANWPMDDQNTPPSGSQFRLIAGQDDGGNSTLVQRDAWLPISATDTAFRVDEYLGHSDLADNDAISRFCVNYMITQLENLPNPNQGAVWLVRVRVSWTKDGFFTPGANGWRNCSAAQVAARITNTLSDSVVELVGAATRELAPVI